MGRAQNTVKQDSFWRGGEVGGRGRGPSLLRRGEKRRTAMPRPGGPWPDLVYNRIGFKVCLGLVYGLFRIVSKFV